MRTILALAAVFVLLMSMTSAEARKRHRHGHARAVPFMLVPAVDDFAASERRRSRRDRQQRPVDAAELVPSDWQLQPPDPAWKGKRFISPDGAAWFAAYSSNTRAEPLASHMKAVAFVDGEQITYVRGEHDWIAVSGVKGERVFYRKARIACGGQLWHHIAFEYPLAFKRQMDRIVARASAAIDKSENDGCEAAAVAADQPPGAPAAPGETTGAPPRR